MQTKCPTYIWPTLEFLSSIELNDLYKKGYDEGYIYFWLFNTEQKLNLKQFNSIFDFP